MILLEQGPTIFTILALIHVELPSRGVLGNPVSDVRSSRKFASRFLGGVPPHAFPGVPLAG
jgi:hypothetical protein